MLQIHACPIRGKWLHRQVGFWDSFQPSKSEFEAAVLQQHLRELKTSEGQQDTAFKASIRDFQSENGTSSAESASPTNDKVDGVALSEREREILLLASKGFNYPEMGKLMGISPHTVTSHVKKIYRKLAVHSRGEAVFEANRMGLIRTL